MNERIKELAQEAGFNLHNDPIDGHDNIHEIDKFAELIVRECIDKVYNFTIHSKDVEQMVLKHFGVKNER